jgi:hypothetical protein
MRINILVITAAVVTAAAAAACSPGTLPGSPSPILVGGGGARYNGSITYRRLGGNYAISEAPQALNLSLSLRDVNQIVGRFETSESSGSVQGVLNGDMSKGTFDATVLVLTTARQGGTTTTCEGQGQIIGTLSGVNLSWTGGSIAYNNCPGLSLSSQAQAVAVSPIPDSFGGRANLVITVLGGAVVPRGTCPTGVVGFPFTVEMSETAGVNVTFDSRFRIEEQRNSGATTSSELDMPFSNITGGTRRSYGACSPVAGTYQAFFSGSDANGNRVRVASPVITLGP